MEPLFIRESRPEHQLLLCVARRSIDQSTAQNIRALIHAGNLDWNYLSTRAVGHGIAALLAHHIQSVASDLTPSSVIDELQRRHQCYVEQYLFLTGQLAKIVGALNERNISCLAFKGPTLASIAYGDVALRQFADLDVLVRQHDVARVKNALERQGFTPFNVLSPARENALLRYENAYAFRNDHEVIVDVHWRFTPAYFALALETEHMWARAQPLEIGAQTVMTLSVEDLVVILCCHGFTHEWERLVWICDVASLIGQRKLDWDYVLQYATGVGVLRIVFVGLLLARELGAPLPPQIERELERDRAVSRFTRQVAERLFATERRQVSLFASVGSQLSIRERLRDKLRLLWRFVLVPRYYDWMFASVPPALSSLYYLIRPIRIARTYGRRMFAGSRED